MTEGLDANDGDDDHRPVVYDLSEQCTVEDVEEGARYRGTVDAVVDYGMFVKLAPAVSGLVHESTYDGSYDEGEELVVGLLAIRDNGDLSFEPVDLEEYRVEQVAHDYDAVDVASLPDREGDVVHLEGEAVQIKQTGGPTLFHIGDGTGVVPCAAFERAGVRAHPDVEVGDFVHVVGSVERRGHGLQVEVDGLAPIDAEREADARDRYEDRLDEALTPGSIEPIVDWPGIGKLLPDLTRVAAQLRRAVLTNRPVLIRHHADTDGMCASIPVELAVERLIEATHLDPDAHRHLVVRLPSRAPYYEMEDATRDLSNALSRQDRHGQKLPLLVMIDNGSTAEDVPAYKHLDSYDIPIVVIDHHSPDPDAVEPFLDAHVNPYRHGEDYAVTAGMLCVELARLLDPDLTPLLRHVPAVAGLADRSTADAMTEYLVIAEDEGYDRDHCDDIVDALDYAAYWLRYDAGRGITHDLLGVPAHRADGEPDPDRHGKLVELFSARARRDIERQLGDALSHLETEALGNEVRLYRVDVERHAHRFTYPPPGTTTGAIHDHMVSGDGEPAITIGYGPDFAVLRSDGVRLDIPTMVAELNEELAGAGVSGGGHLVVGSIRFVPGMREQVLDRLVEKMTDAEIDESLGAAAPREYLSN